MPGETIPSAVFKADLDGQWITTNYDQAGSAPTIVDVNEGAQRNIRVADIRSGDYIILRVDTPAMEERPIGTWVYGHRTSRILLELYTAVNRQRLYDMMGEVRRVMHARMHSLTTFQRIQFVNWNEYTNEQENIWAGRIILEGINSAVLLETT